MAMIRYELELGSIVDDFISANICSGLKIDMIYTQTKKAEIRSLVEFLKS